ncbi:MAG: isoprenylcysteine carboxylmethyltransferase family protein [Candidatus Omnitrophica bacterium]|nr:isoprenylcysteine carboxylmethyltransferase family protein [Candidatus Omnitrophota bacterium]MDE2223251.1 isoprenylcysteine carboxylmethyltransferase family protein [Candidatus Omnitrophota bacterium]
MTKPGFIPPVYFFIFALLSIVLNFLFPVARIVPPSYSYFGIFIIIAGFAFGTWANRLFKMKKIPTRPGEELTQLETSGPFRITRNPMYLGFTTVLLGAGVGLGSLTAFVGPVGFWLAINSIFIPFEEKKLEDKFGNKYLDYKRQVRRWI